MDRTHKLSWGPSIRVVLWVVVWLIVIDVCVSTALASRWGRTTSLARYFEYGRSVEGKLVRSVAADPTKDGAILHAGWIDPNVLRQLPDKPAEATDQLVAVYGQSFSMHAANEAARIDQHLTLRGVGGPAAPPNHSYAAYKADVNLRKADVVVLGVLSTSVGDMGSYSGLIWHFENPAPFTFPRYQLQNGKLTEDLPVIRTEAEFRQAFTQQSPQWQAFKQQLRRNDRGYDRFTFDESVADASSIVRLIRRGWVAHVSGYEKGIYDVEEGFNPKAEDIQALQAMIVDMSRSSQARGERFVVLLLHTLGQSDHLHAVLKDTLDRERVPYISTHTLFSANDPTNFQQDSHYVPAANRKLAEALRAWIRQESPGAALPASGSASAPAVAR